MEDWGSLESVRPHLSSKTRQPETKKKKKKSLGVFGLAYFGFKSTYIIESLTAFEDRCRVS